MDRRVSDEAVEKATGKKWTAWFALLNTAGAKKMDHTEIAHFLSTKHIPNGWWAQTVTVEYERANGLRAVNQARGGTYSVSVHRTVPVSISKLYRAWQKKVRTDPALKKRKLEATTVHPEKNIRYKSGTERLVVSFAAKGPHASRIGIQHENLSSQYLVEQNRAFWRKIFTSLSA